MQVEIIEDVDVKVETPEQSAEALQLIRDLGLTGQMPQAQEQTNTAVGIRFPYRLMTNEELFVYKLLCPEESPLIDYSNSPIPLEVLKTIAYARTLNDARIGCMFVRSASSSKVKDPVLVARNDRWGSKNYILARWADELLPLQVLIPDAIKLWYDQRQTKLAEIKASVELAITMPCPLAIPSNESAPYLSL